LNDPASSPSSSPETTGTCAVKSPSLTRSVARTRSPTGASTERVTSSVSSSDTVNATITATTTSRPRSASDTRSPDDSPATITPVNTLMSGSAPSSFQRSGRPTRGGGPPTGSVCAMSNTSGRSAASEAKKCSTAEYDSATSAAAKMIGAP
jgi:hypothetical protein